MILEYTCILRNKIVNFAVIYLQKDFKYNEW